MFDPAHLVFLDETAANTKMMRVGGRCLRGERLIGHVPHGHWKTITFVGALRCKGMTAPYVIDGAMKGKTFLDYVEHHLAPTLRRNDTVVMDNLPAHKAAGVREAIRPASAIGGHHHDDRTEDHPCEGWAASRNCCFMPSQSWLTTSQLTMGARPSADATVKPFATVPCCCHTQMQRRQ